MIGIIIAFSVRFSTFWNGGVENVGILPRGLLAVCVDEAEGLGDIVRSVVTGSTKGTHQGIRAGFAWERRVRVDIPSKVVVSLFSHRDRDGKEFWESVCAGISAGFPVCRLRI